MLYPQDQVFWYINKKSPNRLTGNIKTNVVIVGGGMAGLSAAQSFYNKGCSVVLLEKSYCGAGASGKSSGFITPDSELNLSHFTRLFGLDKAKKVWKFGEGGVHFIEENIKKFNLACDYQKQDTLVVANSAGALSKITLEYENRQTLAYESILYDKTTISQAIGSNDYFGGIRYGNTFGINTYHYCQAMKEILEGSGVKVFEETPVIKVHEKGVDTTTTTVQADHVIVCADRFAPDIDTLVHDIYHAQTFIMLSAPLGDQTVKTIFPDQNLMVWDTDLIYQYYRIIGENRFLIGGSDLLSIFWGQEQHNSHRIFKKLYTYTKKKFPRVNFNFEYFWPGLIGVSKDIIPIADQDPQLPNVYHISGVAGLPWAAALGHYSAERIIDKNHDFDEFFSLKRKFPVGSLAQSILRKRFTFALSNFISLLR